MPYYSQFSPKNKCIWRCFKEMKDASSVILCKRVHNFPCTALRVFKWLKEYKALHTVERMKSSQDCVWVDTQHQFFSKLTNLQGGMAAAELNSGMIQPSHPLQPLPSAPRDAVCPVFHTWQIHCRALQAESRASMSPCMKTPAAGAIAACALHSDHCSHWVEQNRLSLTSFNYIIRELLVDQWTWIKGHTETNWNCFYTYC